MSTQILKTGFAEIKCDKFRTSNLQNGKEMLSHIYNVEEHRKNGNVVIHGCCLKQMKVSGTSNFYRVELALDPGRNVVSMHCQCVPGVSGLCKHAAALFLYINTERQETRTDAACSWNKPSARGSELYPKGKKMQDLVQTESIRPPAAIEDVKNDMEKHFHLLVENNLKNSAIFKVLSADHVEDINDMNEELLIPEEVVEKVFEPRNTCHFMTSCLISGKLKLCQIQKSIPQVETDFCNDKLKLNLEEAKQLCRNTLRQANSGAWFDGRKYRITASKAHVIARSRNRTTRYRNWTSTPPEGLPGLRYGREMEGFARKKFEQLNACEVHQLGLVLNPLQPWLAGSPDGVTKLGGEYVLLEIKCPLSCKDSPINVGYIMEGQLKKNHPYFAQIQVLLYLCNLKKCIFFVFSFADSVQLEISRIIPKLEEIYYRELLPALCETI